MAPDETKELPFGTLFAAVTDLVLDEIFVWFRLTREPTRAELRDLRRRCEAVPRDANIYINVDAANTRTMRFAAFCGFVEVRRERGISIQVLKGK